MEVLVILWSVTSVAVTIAGLGIFCIRLLRQFLTCAAIDRDDTIRMDDFAAVHDQQLRKHTVVFLQLACTVSS